jgi:cardiolipin synthase (CMP-forming)
MHWPAPTSALFAWLVALLCVASGLDYVIRWSRRAWRIRHPT